MGKGKTAERRTLTLGLAADRRSTGNKAAAPNLQVRPRRETAGTWLTVVYRAAVPV